MATPSGLLPATQPYWIDALIPNFGEGVFRQLLGGSNIYNFTFPLSLPSYDFIPDDGYQYLPFNADQQNVARGIFAELSGLLDLHFVETWSASQANTIALANNFQQATAGYTYYPSSSFLGSDVFLDRSTLANLSMRTGSSGLLTLIHELGHALGLKHPFSHADASGDSGEPPFLTSQEDSARWTVMSYTSTPAQYHADFADLDIAALQYLYGPSTTARIGNDTYRVEQFSPSFFWDGGGEDVIDASHLSVPVTLSLEPGYWGYVGSKATSITSAGQATVNYGSVFEGLRGGAGGDFLDGNSVANELRGNGGNDTLYGERGDDLILGGAGTDTAGFLGRQVSYSLVATAGGYKVVDNLGGRDGTDSLLDVELLRFTDRSVDLTMALRAQQVNAGTLKTLEELYVGFFNRIPEAQGLAYWIDRLQANMGLADIANQFYDAGVQFGIYAAGQSSAQFVQQVYANVLARQPGSATAPSAAEMTYWENQLSSGVHSKGSMVLQMLDDVHGRYATDPTWSFVAKLLDNKAAVANLYAVQMGMGLNIAQDNIGFGKDLVALITPTDVTQAVALIGQVDFS